MATEKVVVLGVGLCPGLSLIGILTEILAPYLINLLFRELKETVRDY